MTSDFASEVAKYPQSSPKLQIAQNRVRAYCLAPLALQLVRLLVCGISWPPLEEMFLLWSLANGVLSPLLCVA